MIGGMEQLEQTKISKVDFDCMPKGLHAQGGGARQREWNRICVLRVGGPSRAAACLGSVSAACGRPQQSSSVPRQCECCVWEAPAGQQRA